MASADIRRLWKLHLVDTAIQSIRNQAANLDVGQGIQKEIETLQKALDANGYRKKHAEVQDLELQQKSIEDKIARTDRELYGGSVVNPREVENLEKEIARLKAQKSEIEGHLLELWEEMPPLKTEADGLADQIEQKKKQIAELRKLAVGKKAELESAYKTKTAERALLAKEQNPSLLAKYESIRQRHHGVGMAEFVKGKQCGACGTLLPERTLQAAISDKVVTCESCHRILYYTEGVV